MCAADSWTQTRSPKRSGLAVVLVLVCTAVVGALLASMTLRQIRVAEQQLWWQYDHQCRWLLESGFQRAWAQLVRDPGYRGETWEPKAAGSDTELSAMVQITVEPVANEKYRIHVVAQFPYPTAATKKSVTKTSVYVASVPLRNAFERSTHDDHSNF